MPCSNASCDRPENCKFQLKYNPEPADVDLLPGNSVTVFFTKVFTFTLTSPTKDDGANANIKREGKKANAFRVNFIKRFQFVFKG